MKEHSKVALAVFSTFFIVLLIGIVVSLKILLWPILIGFLISFILDPVVDYFESLKFNRLLIICVIFSVVSLLVLFTLFYFLQPIVTQSQKLIADAPAYFQLTKSYLLGLAKILSNRYPSIDWVSINSTIVDHAEQISANLMQSVLTIFTNIFGIIASAVIVPFVTFFLLKDGSNIKKQVISLIPNAYFEMALTLFYKVHRQISSYIRGTLLDCTIIAILYAIGYAIIQVKYAVLIGMFAGMANLVPYVGPWIAAVIPLAIILFDSGASFPWWSVVVVVTIVQFIENNFVYPIVLGKSINMHPLIIMFGLFVGGEMGGLLGMVLAIPVIAVIKVIAEELYKGLKQYSIV